MTIRYARIEYSELLPLPDGKEGELECIATIFMGDGETFTKAVQTGGTMVRSRPRDQIMELVRVNVESFAKRVTREDGKWFLERPHDGRRVAFDP